MTRDEAINTFFSTMYPNSTRPIIDKQWAEQAINTYIKLGMLKVEEPTPAIDKLFAQLSVIPLQDRTSGVLLICLEKAGVKVVDK